MFKRFSSTAAQALKKEIQSKLRIRLSGEEESGAAAEALIEMSRQFPSGKSHEVAMHMATLAQNPEGLSEASWKQLQEHSSDVDVALDLAGWLLPFTENPETSITPALMEGLLRSSLASSRHLRSASEFLDAFHSRNLQPPEGAAEQLLQLRNDAVARGDDPEQVLHYFAYGEMLVMSGNLAGVEAMLDEMAARKAPIGAHHRFLLVEAYCAAGLPSKAEALVRAHELEFRKFGVGVAFRLVADTYRALGDEPTASQLETFMASKDIPKSIAFDPAAAPTDSEILQKAAEIEPEAVSAEWTAMSPAERMASIMNSLSPAERLRQRELIAIQSYLQDFSTSPSM